MVEQIITPPLDNSLSIALPQKDGLRRLKECFEGKIGFQETSPFLLDKVFGDESSKYAYVGAIKGKNVALRVSQEMQKVLASGGKFLAIPGEDEFYRWLNFYELYETNSVAIQPTSSCRVDLETHLFHWNDWPGPNKQLFLDYLNGSVDVTPSRLREFQGRIISPVRSHYTVVIGTVDGKGIKTLVEENSLVQEGQEVLFKPKYIPSKNYSWIEGYIKDADGKEQAVCSRRFFKGEKHLYPWKGSATQAVIDWVLGILPISEVEPLTVMPSDKSLSVTLEQTYQHKIVINLKGHSAISGEAVTLVPEKDSLYEWIEVYQAKDRDSDKSSPIAAFKVTRESPTKLDGTWSGPVKQRYIDFLDKKVGIDELTDLSSIVDSDTNVYLFRYQEKAIRLGLRNVASKFSPSEKVIITPSEDEKNLILMVSGEHGQKEIFTMNRETMKVTSLNQLRKLKYPKPEGYWTVDRVMFEALEFYRSKGDISQSILAKAGRDDLSHAIRKVIGGMIPLKEKIRILMSQEISSEEAERIFDEEMGWQ